MICDSCLACPVAPNFVSNKAATTELALPVRLSPAGAVAPYRQGKLVASQLPKAGEFDAPLMIPWPFLLCQKPIVAASPAPRFFFGGCGVSFTLAEQVDWQPVGTVIVTMMVTGLFKSEPAFHLSVGVF